VPELLILDGPAVRDRIPVASGIDALERLFGSERLPDTPLRAIHQNEDRQLILMPSFDPAVTGVKLVTVVPENASRGLPLIGGVFVLFAGDSLQPVAVLDGAALTAVRTAALSGLATRWLADKEASRLIVFGAGVQARGHIEAMCAVRPIATIGVVEPASRRVAELIEWGASRGLEIEPAVPADVADAEIVCTCTTSAAPVFDGKLLRPDAHVNAIGAYSPATRELDSEAIRGATVVVEERDLALAEAGDLLIPIAEGILSEDDVNIDLQAVVRGTAALPEPPRRTVFKAVGGAFEDLAVANALYESVV